MDLKVNSTTKVAILLSLYRKPLHGYALMDSVEESFGLRPGPAQIYPFLSELLKKKLVSALKAGVRDKTEYVLTVKGREVVGELMVKMGVLLEGALNAKLTQCTHCSCKMFGKPFIRKIGGHAYPFCCGHCADNFLGGKKKAK